MTVQMPLGGFEDISRYNLWIEGVLPGVPLEAGRDSLIVGAREAFTSAFCGGSASAPKAVCRCTYVELTRREPFPVLLAQVDRSRGRRISPAIVSAARACGAKGPA